jgi:two-component system, NarL family, sensor histidine kinase BarA
MSYRAFKRLLGETSLERKCRFLFGGATLLLISASFYWYARQTEGIAYREVTKTGRLLFETTVRKLHEKLTEPPAEEVVRANTGNGNAHDNNKKTVAPLTREQWLNLKQSLDQVSDQALAEGFREYKYWLIKPNARSVENQSNDSFEIKLLHEYGSDQGKPDESRHVPSERRLYTYHALRAQPGCLTARCHPLHSEEPLYGNGLKSGSLMALVKIQIPTDQVESGVHENWALLIAAALVSAILLMTGSYLIVRYIIVKPVKHLKEVSDAISAGELNVRSEIQTGDEFEDLSHAFNRMLRNLLSMQDRLRKVNSDLDLKVDELAQANMALYESNRLKSDFLATMSHELRTPLNSILGFSDVLLGSDSLQDKQLRWVRNIRTSGEQLLNLINDILDLAKIEAGKMQVRVEEFSIRDVCEGLFNLFRPFAEKKNIELKEQIATDIPLLRQDAGKLQQILSNLLSNAIKFTPEGGRVLLKVDADAMYVTVIVSDTGVGIAPEDQELVFEKFRQAGNPLTREHAGTGLGLSIVRELSKLLGGEVTLQSELGRGSTFSVRLPLHLSQEPRLEFDLADQGIDLSKAQRVDNRLETARPGVHAEEGKALLQGPAEANW